MWVLKAVKAGHSVSGTDVQNKWPKQMSATFCGCGEPGAGSGAELKRQ